MWAHFLHRAILAGILFGLAGLGGCIQGGGTDVGNALVEGRVTDNGIPLAGARVLLMPEGYNPVLGDPTGAARNAVADGEGRYSIPDVRPGRYSLETRHPTLERMDWIPIVDVGAEDRITADPEMDGARTVLVRLPEGAAADAFVFIPGTDVQALRASGDTTAGGWLHLRHVPLTHVPVMGVGRTASPGAIVLYPVSLPATDSLAILDRQP